jgi:hypothetical protein
MKQVRWEREDTGQRRRRRDRGYRGDSRQMRQEGHVGDAKKEQGDREEK